MPKTFKWTVEFEVSENWVADGFTLTDERALAMLANDLSYAYGHELGAKVIKHPSRMAVLTAFGCTKARIEKAIAEMPNGATALPNEVFDWMHDRTRKQA